MYVQPQTCLNRTIYIIRIYIPPCVSTSTAPPPRPTCRFAHISHDDDSVALEHPKPSMVGQKRVVLLAFNNDFPLFVPPLDSIRTW